MSRLQYVEENERLRAILGEWSARAAKVELKFLDSTIRLNRFTRICTPQLSYAA